MAVDRLFKARREELGITLNQAGRVLGISRQLVFDIETGRRRLSRRAVERAAAFLRVDPEFLDALCGRAPASLAQAAESGCESYLAWRPRWEPSAPESDGDRLTPVDAECE